MLCKSSPEVSAKQNLRLLLLTYTRFGTALGYFVGGLLGDWLGIIAPFRVTLVLFCLSTVYGYLFLPHIPLSEEVEKKASKSIGAFFDPLKMFVPKKWMLRNGTVQREYGVLLLGAGAFLAVFATGVRVLHSRMECMLMIF